MRKTVSVGQLSQLTRRFCSFLKSERGVETNIFERLLASPVRLNACFKDMKAVLDQHLGGNVVSGGINLPDGKHAAGHNVDWEDLTLWNFFRLQCHVREEGYRFTELFSCILELADEGERIYLLYPDVFSAIYGQSRLPRDSEDVPVPRKYWMGKLRDRLEEDKGVCKLKGISLEELVKLRRKENLEFARHALTEHPEWYF